MIFAKNQQVFIHDLHRKSTEKWRTEKVTKHLGTHAYEVSMNGHVRKAHVDHMRP